MTQCVLDTSALLTYIENEEGATEVEALLQKAIDDEIVLYITSKRRNEIKMLSVTDRQWCNKRSGRR